jgi:hypothetical protein
MEGAMTATDLTEDEAYLTLWVLGLAKMRHDTRSDVPPDTIDKAIVKIRARYEELVRASAEREAAEDDGRRPLARPVG